MIDGLNFFDQPLEMKLEHLIAQVKKMTNRTGCSLDYAHFNENYKLIVTDLSKRQVLNTDSNAIQ